MLGVRWHVETDHFVLDVSEVSRQARSLPPTKRNIVSLVGRIYDSLGFLSPALVSSAVDTTISQCEEGTGVETIPI